jgi:ubiquinone/menaquinone biosynthesis C-methylase UbiE
VPESRFGIWFLGTRIWVEYVLKPALDNLERLIPKRRASYPTILDYGCGFGRSLKILNDRFRPDRIIAIDCDPQMLGRAQKEAQRHGLAVEFGRVSSSAIALADQSVDMILCHQTFHHVVDQEGLLAEFHRVSKPDGVLLFAESTRRYIESWIIRLLFRHPKDSQRSASEYLAMIGSAGFQVPTGSVSYPYLWWSRADFGVKQFWLGIMPPAGREEILVNLVAVRD